MNKDNLKCYGCTIRHSCGYKYFNEAKYCGKKLDIFFIFKVVGVNLYLLYSKLFG